MAHILLLFLLIAPSIGTAHESVSPSQKPTQQSDQPASKPEQNAQETKSNQHRRHLLRIPTPQRARLYPPLQAASASTKRLPTGALSGSPEHWLFWPSVSSSP